MQESQLSWYSIPHYMHCHKLTGEGYRQAGMDKIPSVARVRAMKFSNRGLWAAAMVFGLSGVLGSAEEAAKMAPPKAEEKNLEKAEKSENLENADVPAVVKTASVMIDGKSVQYRVTAGKLMLKQDDGTKRAGIFHVSYERTDVKDPAARPIMFAFNGGPGSSAVWLHIGVLGPKIVKLPGDGTLPPVPPSLVTDNPASILDVCDLVFIDPVSTGYSRVEKDVKAADFHGVKGDISSVADFIRRWVTEHDRWASPKYLLGESYGGVRAAGLSDQLQSKYGMQLNGVVLLSTLLDFATLDGGNDLSDLVYLPSYAGAALHHGKVKAADREAFLQQTADFAFGPYATALLKGNVLDDAEKREIAAKLAAFTGLPAETWETHDLRINPSFFRTELLRTEGKVLGRFDARVAWPTATPTALMPEYDPSFSLAYGAFSTALMDYLGRGIGYKEERPYEILSGKVNPWEWDSENKPLDLSESLAEALRDNPALRVLVLSGSTDLATPPEGVAYSLRHLPLAKESLVGRVTTAHFAGGHMFYLNPPDLVKCREVLKSFLSGK